jgi:predicted HicB family RNase H-like nuclease
MAQYLMNFSEDLHREAKVRAAQEGITLKALIEKVLQEYLKTSKKKGGK